MAAQSVFNGGDIELLSVTKDYPEIQADTSLEIARYTALMAASDLQAPAIREDHSLFINALDAPGPYANFFEKKVDVARLLKILKSFEDRTGFFEVATVYAEPSGFVKEFIFQVPIFFATEERGSLQGGWSRIITLKGETRTLAEYPETDRIELWSKNYKAIDDFIKNKI